MFLDVYQMFMISPWYSSLTSNFLMALSPLFEITLNTNNDKIRLSEAVDTNIYIPLCLPPQVWNFIIFGPKILVLSNSVWFGDQYTCICDVHPQLLI